MSNRNNILIGIAIVIVLLLSAIVFKETVLSKNKQDSGAVDSTTVADSTNETDSEEVEKAEGNDASEDDSKSTAKKTTDDKNTKKDSSDSDDLSDSDSSTETAKSSGTGKSTGTTQPSGTNKTTGTGTSQPSGTGSTTTPSQTTGSGTQSTDTTSTAAPAGTTDTINTTNTTTPADTTASTDTVKTTVPAETTNTTEAAESTANTTVPADTTANTTVPADTTEKAEASEPEEEENIGLLTDISGTIAAKPEDKTVEVTGVSLDKNSMDLYVGDALTLKETVSPDNATNRDVTWSSSDSSVAAVNSDGTVTATGVGTTTITVSTSNNKIATCEVVVNTKVVEVSSVTLNISSSEMFVDDTVALSATVLPADATYKSVTWGSSDENVATVNGDGVVTAKGPGIATITASTLSGKAAACAITVSTKPIAVSSVTLDKETAEMTVEDTLTLTANVMPADADDKSVTWSSSNESILIVSDTGIVTAKAAGTATVTVIASNNMAATCDITVAEKVAPPTIVEVTSVSLDQTSASIFTDETVRLAAVVAPADATDKSVTWTSGDESIATVSGDGLVTPVATGNVTITVTTANGKTATCAVTISTRPVAVESISLDKTSMEMYAGDSVTLAATVLPSDATDKSVMWTSNNARVATVSDTGAISAEGVGTATITALTSNGKTAVCVISVKAKPIDVTSVALDKTSMDMYVDDSVTLSATISPADATDKSLTWTSGDSNIVTVSNTGSVKAKKAGTTTVTVTTANGKTATCSVTVKNKTVDVTSISVNTASATLKVKDTLSLSATVLPADATDKTVTWSSSAVLIAVVSNTGTVTAKSEGTAVITAKTANGKTATCTITVKKEEEEEIEKDLNSLFKVPYIATYYFDFRPTVNDNIQIPLYLTDFEQSEYLKNDTTKTLDLIYEVDGVKKTIKNIPLGDYTLTIGKLSEGMHTFAVQARDNTTGMTSHKLYNELWVEASNTISALETYYMTSADLTKYDIHNDNSTNADDLISTRDGLTQLFADKQAEGYKKIVLLAGTYRINGADARMTCITIPSYFTVDMNGATFKLDTIDYETPGSIIFMNDATDAHLTNGTLEGDRFERQALNLEYYPAGEGINAFYIYGGRYCSISNLTVKNNTGHSLMTQYNPYGVNLTLNEFTRSIIVDGKEQTSDSCSTSSMMDLTSILNFDPEGRYMYVGHPGGYKGIVGDSPVIYVSFYDENQNFLETVTGYQFRKMKIIDGAKYARVTFLGTDFPSTDLVKSAHIYAQHNTDYFEASNITFIDTRTTCFAPTAVTNMLIQNCKYIRCSVGITPCQVDFEDGQEMCQDVYYMNNEVVEKVKGNTCTLVDNIGYNHIYDGNINHSYEIRNRVIGGLFRNIDDETSFITWKLGTKTKGGYGRIYNNTCCNIRFDSTTSDAPVEFRVKNCKMNNQKPDDKLDTNKWIVADAEKVTYENCEFPYFAGSNATFENCTLSPANAIGNNIYFYNCTIGTAGVTSKYNLSNYENMNREFYNCHFVGQTEFNNGGLKSAKFTECVFDDLSMTPCTGNSDEALIFDKCTINSTYDKFLNIGPFAYSPASSLNIVFKDSVITHTGNNLIYSLARTSYGSQIYFENCTINKSSGNLFSGYNAVQEGDGLAVTFKNTDVDSDLSIDGKYIDSDSYTFTYED